jgi:hypothetical protein
VSGALLENLHDGERVPDFWIVHEQVNVFGHDRVSDDRAIAPAHLFENRKQAVAAASVAEEREPVIAGTSDKVQMMRAVGAMQPAGHGKSYAIGCIVPALAKNARAGHPQFRNGKGSKP